MGSVLRHAPDGSGSVNTSEGFTAQQWWNRWTTGLGLTDDAGNTRILDDHMRRSLDRGIRIAHTEWNWNGWFSGGDEVGVNVYPAMGIGVATYLNGLVRDGGSIAFANMSMLVGKGWNIPAVRVPEGGEAFLGPQGQAVGFYRRHARGWRMAHDVANMPTFTLAQSDAPNQISTHSLVDAVVTGDSRAIAVHLVSRSHATSVSVEIDLSALHRGLAETAEFHVLVPHSPGASYDDDRAIFIESTQSLPVAEKMSVELPPQSIAVVVIGGASP